MMNYVSEERTIKGKIIITNYLPHIGIGNVKEEIVNDLNKSPKKISSKFFYDQKGSKLFEDITRLKEYYPTRTEIEILKSIVDKIDIDLSNLNIVELGSGDSSKIKILLNQIDTKDLDSLTYTPVDISKSAIEDSSKLLEKEFPTISINGIVADFVHQTHMLPKSENRLFCFFGSTIGNFEQIETEDFMKNLGKQMHVGDSLLMGIDMIKDIDILEDAYNDSLNVTADFNLNILNVVNNLINSDFKGENFEHVAFFNKGKSRIEMHLRAKENLKINIDDELIVIDKGEMIHTENSHKFDEGILKKLGNWAGIEIEQICSDDNNWFSLVHFRKNK